MKKLNGFGLVTVSALAILISAPAFAGGHGAMGATPHGGMGTPHGMPQGGMKPPGGGMPHGGMQHHGDMKPSGGDMKPRGMGGPRMVHHNPPAPKPKPGGNGQGQGQGQTTTTTTTQNNNQTANPTAYGGQGVATIGNTSAVAKAGSVTGGNTTINNDVSSGGSGGGNTFSLSLGFGFMNAPTAYVQQPLYEQTYVEAPVVMPRRKKPFCGSAMVWNDVKGGCSQVSSNPSPSVPTSAPIRKKKDPNLRQVSDDNKL